MRFRVQNIRKGYCEVWANTYDGGRYHLLANVKKGCGNDWCWSPSETPQAFIGPFTTRAACVRDCKRTMLVLQIEHAIEMQPKESEHWHSPRRDAWCTVTASHLFTRDELDEIKKRLTTFEERNHG